MTADGPQPADTAAGGAGALAGAEPQLSPQFAIPLGLWFGLLLTAALCLGYGWLHHTPWQPFQADRGDITAMLWRTTLVVAVSALLSAGYLGVGRVYRRSTGRRARFLAFTWSALMVLAIGGVVVLYRGRTAEVFRGAAAAQQGLGPVHVAAVARAAWWCACLAVMALAIVSVFGYLWDGSRSPKDISPLWTSRLFAGAVGAAVVVVVAVSVAAADTGSLIVSRTAGRIDAPPTPTPTGRAAYQMHVGTSDRFVPAGAGFVRVIKADTRSQPDRIEGYDGASGKPRWSFSFTGSISADSLAATGVGPDSVVVVRANNATDVLIGIDATTGTPLWARSDESMYDPSRGSSARVVLTTREVPDPAGQGARRATRWTALSPKTGAVLWTKDFRYRCDPKAQLTDTAVLVSSCDDEPDVVATVLDPESGETRGAIRASALGVEPAELGPDRGRIELDDARGNLALVAVSRYGPARRHSNLVVDIASGKVVRTVPDGDAAGFIDAQSLRLTAADHAESILDLQSGAVIPTGLFSPDSGASHRDRYWSRVGSDWATFLSDQGEAPASPPLRVIDAKGATRTFGYPCPNPVSGFPAVTAIPGALLVGCGEALAGIR
ncbi:PQQ-binding-like beta-propeller repeat protein [Mycobacterium talmoniae]|uniref:Pyrrolo-quinoline quinone repeat domain-containing protein n=1 Tax=Mycobacterium talmoniae TaxID=1858794 RepID=A0A1S1NDZ6_9MYCO|nr:MULTISPECIES: PQQ-binding-like beta-propeller repeat protein [Mycobacterium]OHV03851.1 hypothetical protein BKN37_12845 [Mycobacterium talmoniae]PQM45811.1 hypothetical protein C1Y40_04022 [Mycobacterium talmoniae]TDH56221.1 hypothetical protein E2F47_08170 [Mycobacterium eburneum]